MACLGQIKYSLSRLLHGRQVRHCSLSTAVLLAELRLAQLSGLRSGLCIFLCRLFWLSPIPLQAVLAVTPFSAGCSGCVTLSSAGYSGCACPPRPLQAVLAVPVHPALCRLFWLCLSTPPSAPLPSDGTKRIKKNALFIITIRNKVLVLFHHRCLRHGNG